MLVLLVICFHELLDFVLTASLSTDLRIVDNMNERGVNFHKTPGSFPISPGELSSITSSPPVPETSLSFISLGPALILHLWGVNAFITFGLRSELGLGWQAALGLPASVSSTAE